MYKSGLVELEAVVAIARRGSFRAAALDLDMSPTAIGNAVASLEKRLGVRLFNRTTRNVALTSAGREYVEAIAPALSDIRNATQAVLETGNGIADCCRRHVQIEGRRTEASEPGDGDHSLEFHQSTLVHYRDFPVTASQFISIIAMIKVCYGAAIFNDARRLECPKPVSLTSSSAP